MKGEELYPESLKKQIKLLKRTSDGELVSDFEGEKIELYESFQNINSFSISEDFTYAAISIDRVGIILICGYPNLLECDNKEIKMVNLPEIMFGEKKSKYNKS